MKIILLKCSNFILRAMKVFQAKGESPVLNEYAARQNMQFLRFFGTFCSDS